LTPRHAAGTEFTMKTHLVLGVGLVLTGCLLAACDRRADQNATNRNPTNQNPTAAAPDNTARNKGDMDSSAKTPLDQSNTSVDTRITAEIRRAIMDDDAMSMNAQNCKIITDSAGIVTLRGPVESQAERSSIEAKAKAVAGVTRVVNELEVKTDDPS